MDTITGTPDLVLLLTAFRLTHAANPLACRAADRLIDHLSRQSIRYEIDDTTLRVQSFGHEPNAIHTATLLRCSCRGGRHPWCQHRVLRAVLLAQRALTSDADDDPPERIPCFPPPPPLDLPHASDAESHARAFAEMDALFG